MVMVQPDCAGVIPSGPVSWYAVASPCADSGFAGTMMSQLTLAAVVVVAVLVVPDGVGHGAAELIGVVGAVPVVAVPVAAAVAVAVLEAAVVGVVVLEAAVVGDAVPEPAVVGEAVLEAAVVG
ncbi:MAG TPA: hypothetical protein VK784_02190, partial [Pseudonocardiaceae bacterium]|nr:hypothetical protein [Pseudonocardiaceae bacterium]